MVAIGLNLSVNTLSAQILLNDWTSVISGSDDVTINDMVIDENNGVFYIVGYFEGDASSSFPTVTPGSNQDFTSNYGGEDGFVAKYDLTGNLLWAFHVGGVDDDEVATITVENNGNFYIGGHYDSSTNPSDNDNNFSFEGIIPSSMSAVLYPCFHGGGIDIFESKYSPSGQMRWRQIDGGLNDDYVTDVVIHNSSVYYTGYFLNECEFGNAYRGTNNSTIQAYVLKRNRNNSQYEELIFTNGTGAEYGKKLLVKGNDIFWFGEFNQDFCMLGSCYTISNTNDKIFYLKLNQNLTTSTGSSFICDTKLTFEDATTNNSSNQIIITGMYEGNLSYTGSISSTYSSDEDIFLASLSVSNFNLNWHKEFQTLNANELASGKSVALMANNGGIFLGCEFEGTLVTGGGNIISASNKDAAILVLDNLGNYQSSVLGNSTSDVNYSYLQLNNSDTELYFFNNYEDDQYIQSLNNSGNSKTRGLYGRYAVSNTPPSCSFTYLSNSLCDDNANPIPNYIELSGGIFSTSGSINLANTSTGEIDLANSVGTGYIIYEVMGCTDSLIFSVKPRFDASVTNLPTSLCQVDTNIALMPFVTGDTDGVWLGSPLSQDTLMITTTVPTNNTVNLTYSNPPSGYCPNSTSFTINLVPTFDPTWSFNPDTICDGSPNINLAPLANTNGGTWSGVGVTGSQLNVPGLNVGQYTITYSSPIGTCADSEAHIITIMPQFDASLSGIPSSICQGDTIIDLTNYNSGSTNGYWSGTFVQGTNLIINSNFNGVINLVYENNPNSFCYNSSNASINVITNFDPSWNINPQICNYEPIIDLSTLVTGTPNGNWTGANITGSSLDVSSLTGTSYPITYSGSQNGCGSDSTITITILSPYANAGSDDSICDLSYSLVGTTTSSSINWSTTSSAISFSNPNSISSNVDASTSGNYSLLLTAQDGNCSFTDTLNIQFYETPIVDAGEDQIVTSDIYTLDGSSNVSNNLWVILEGNSSLSDDSNLNSDATTLTIGENIFEITGENGFCPNASDEVIINYNIIEIPNSFTPNNDGFNDNFVIVGLELFDNPTFTIINKWGEILEVFENYQNDWNGIIAGKELVKGTYFYTLEFNDNKIKGFIDLNK